MDNLLFFIVPCMQKYVQNTVNIYEIMLRLRNDALLLGKYLSEIESCREALGLQ